MTFKKKSKETISDANIHLDSGRSYLIEKNYDAAMKEFERTIALDPDNKYARFEIGKIYLEKNDMDSAQVSFEKALVLDPRNDKALVEIGKIFWRKKEYVKAKEAYERAAALDHANPSAHLGLGKVHRFLGSYDVSQKELELSYKLDPKNISLGKWLQQSDGAKGQRHKKPPYRVHFTWGMHYECNYRCSYCYAPKPEHPDLKTKPHYKAVYPGIKCILSAWDVIAEKYGNCRIRLDGGEPSVYPNFLELVRKLSKKHHLQINTNLSFDTDIFVKDIDPGAVRIDGSLHPEYLSADEYASKIKTLRKNGFKVVVSYVGYPPFLRSLEEYKKKAEDAGAVFIIHPYSGDYKGRKYPDSYTPEEKRLLYEKDLQSKNELEWRSKNNTLDGCGTEQGLSENYYETITRKKPLDMTKLKAAPSFSGHGPAKAHEIIGVNPTGKNDKICYMGYMYARIYPNGDVYRCCTDDGLLSLGNLYNGTFSLLDEPQPCGQQGCRCWRCMVPNEEQRWLHTWVDDWEMPF
jgi:Tfp pilus assembly protein PilF/MoaA/NifB/PqqE/SkfB family radical SAM enzyme